MTMTLDQSMPMASKPKDSLLRGDARSHCSNCHEEGLCRKRSFSSQVWTLLLLWDEVKAQAVEQSICDTCYMELREILMERVEEVEAALSSKREAQEVPALEEMNSLAS